MRNEELHNLFSSLNIITVIKSRRTRWAGHVACMVEMRNAYKILVEKLKGGDCLKYVGIDGRVIIKRILKNRV